MELNIESIRERVEAAGYIFMSSELFDNNRRIEIRLAKNRLSRTFGVRGANYPDIFKSDAEINEAVSNLLQHADNYYGKI